MRCVCEIYGSWANSVKWAKAFHRLEGKGIKMPGRDTLSALRGWWYSAPRPLSVLREVCYSCISSGTELHSEWVLVIVMVRARECLLST